MASEELKDVDVSVLRKLQCCEKCSEWEEKYKQTEESFAQLRTEFENKMIELKLLPAKISELGPQGAQKCDKVESLENPSEDIEEKITTVSDGCVSTAEARKQVEEFTDLSEGTEDNKLMELMTEIEVLNVEKKKAESDVRVWKTKCSELECRVIELDKRLTFGAQEFSLAGVTELGKGKADLVGEETNTAKGMHDEPSDVGTPVGDTYRNAAPLEKGKIVILSKNKLEYGSRSRKQLFFGEETNFSKRIAPVTPSTIKPACHILIDISDSDVEVDGMELIVTNEKERNKGNDITYPSGFTALDKNHVPSDLTVPFDQHDEDNVTRHNDITRKRRRAANIITSDSESDGDDNLPISRFRNNSKTVGDGESVVRRRLVPWRNLDENGTLRENAPVNLDHMKTERLCGKPTTVTLKEDESEEDDDSECEHGSLEDFIVRDDDLSSDGSASNSDNSSTDVPHSHSNIQDELGDEAVSDINFGEIIATIGRFKDQKGNWEFQADLLAALGKDPELCLKAVCALYRQQTPNEKVSKATIIRNGQGLSQVDAYRGSDLGEFLTDGYPNGDLRKSVEELEAYDKKGLEKCRDLALKYSNQLFELYRSGKDPFWRPSESK